MVSLQITDTDAFLDMPATSQLLYFHLVIRADDEGFVSNPKKISRLIGIQNDDLKVLIAKRFVLEFESGVVVIKHWLIHNNIRMDRFNKTVYQDEKESLIIKENKAYTELATARQPDDNQKSTLVKLSKVKLNNHGEASSPKKFSFSKYINQMKEDKRKHIRFIGWYFTKRKSFFPDEKTIKTEIKRWVKDASFIVRYPQEKIASTQKFVERKFPEEWNMSTIKKYLSEK